MASQIRISPRTKLSKYNREWRRARLNDSPAESEPAPRWALASHTFCGGGGGVSAPCDLPNYWTDFQKQTPFDTGHYIHVQGVRELSKQGVKFDLEVTDRVTGQVS